MHAFSWKIFFLIFILILLIGCKSEETITTKAVDASKDIGTISTFKSNGAAAIATEDGKPVVILFSTTWCPHCKWIKETFDNVAKEYDGQIAAYHWELDTKDNTLTDETETNIPAEHMALYQEFNPRGSIPTYVFGGKYYRIGNGYERSDDLEAEAEEFRAVIEALI